jgi:hypothetical protein
MLDAPDTLRVGVLLDALRDGSKLRILRSFVVELSLAAAEVEKGPACMTQLGDDFRFSCA